MHSKHLWRKLALTLHQQKGPSLIFLNAIGITRRILPSPKKWSWTTVRRLVWYIYYNEVLVNRLFRSYGTLRSTLYDLKQLRTPLGAQFIDYLRKHNWPADSWRAQVKVRLLDWIAASSVFNGQSKRDSFASTGTQKTASSSSTSHMRILKEDWTTWS